MSRTLEQRPPTRAGEAEAAFSARYRRHFGRLYDFCIRIARDRDLAALAVQEAFLSTNAESQSDQPPAPFDVALYVAAHHGLAQRLRRGRQVAAKNVEPFAVPDTSQFTDPSLTPDLPEVAALCWQAAEALRLDDYELIDLSIRQGWNIEEIASAFRSRPKVQEQRLAQCLARFETDFSARLLAARRADCLQLDVVMAEDTWSSKLRRGISRHLADCPLCQARRLRYPPAAAVLRSLALVPAPAGWEETMADRLQEAVSSGFLTKNPSVEMDAVDAGRAVYAASSREAEEPAAAGGAGRDIIGPPGSHSDRMPIIGALGGGLLIMAALLGGMCATGAFGGGGKHSLEAGVTGSTATAAQSATGTKTLVASTRTKTPAPTFTPVPTQKKKRH